MSGLDLIRELEGELKRVAHLGLTLAGIVKSDTCRLAANRAGVIAELGHWGHRYNRFQYSRSLCSVRLSSPSGCMLSVLLALG